MRHRHRVWLGIATLLVLLCSVGLAAAEEATLAQGRTEAGQPKTASQSAASKPTPTPTPARKYTTETVRGKVVWLDDALARLYGVTTEPAAAETAVVLETPAGQLLPIVPDTRGRSFAVDTRLRNIDLRLLVRRYEGVPMIQVIRVLRAKADGLYEIDYWCDICAIPMHILKPCECCQGPTRLRERLVETGQGGGTPK
jgi:hypothetical protein